MAHPGSVPKQVKVGNKNVPRRFDGDFHCKMCSMIKGINQLVRHSFDQVQMKCGCKLHASCFILYRNRGPPTSPDPEDYGICSCGNSFSPLNIVGNQELDEIKARFVAEATAFLTAGNVDADLQSKLTEVEGLPN